MHPVQNRRLGRRIAAMCAAGAALVAGATVASAVGSSPAGPTSGQQAAAPLPQAPGDPQSVDAFVPVTPVRVLDTRGAPNGPVGVSQVAPMGPGQQIDLTLAGSGRPVPAGATSAGLRDNATPAVVPAAPTPTSAAPTGNRHAIDRQ